MPLLFIVLGVLLLVAAIKNTYQALFQQLGQDIPGYLPFAAAVVGIGMLGYIPKFQNPARMLLALVFVVLLLTKDKGFFAQFLQALSGQETPVTPEVAKTAPVAPGPFPVTLIGGAGVIGKAAGLLTGSTPASTAGSTAGAIGATGI